jgi:hypothetical protein
MAIYSRSSFFLNGKGETDNEEARSHAIA